MAVQTPTNGSIHFALYNQYYLSQIALIDDSVRYVLAYFALSTISIKVMISVAKENFKVGNFQLLAPWD